MLIDTLLSLLKEAASLPFFMWKHNFVMARKSIIYDLEKIQSGIINQNVPSAQKLNSFIKLLKKSDQDELALASGFFQLGEIFSAAKVHNDKINEYTQLTNDFIRRIKKEQIFSSARAAQKEKLSEVRREEYDRKLFVSEGLDYCLIYYLSFYKELSNINGASAKEAFIKQKEIDFGTGKIMGILEDFNRDECPEKFIMLILNNETRTSILAEYYFCKQTVLSSKSFMEVEAALHDFIQAMLVIFDEHKVATVNNGMWAPYGESATVKELITLFSKEYALAK